MLDKDFITSHKQKQEHHNMQAPNTVLTAYERPEDIPMTDARALLQAHVTWAYNELRAMGVPPFDPNAHMERFFSNLDKVTPPNGVYFMAHDARGSVLGTGSLSRVSEDTAEMKHLYVCPEARSLGLGHKLITARIEVARQLGIKRIVADTFKGNDPMIRLYKRLGFADTPPFDSLASSLSPEVVPFLRYFEMDL